MESAEGIEIKGMGRRFGAQWVLAHLDLSVRRGEAVALFGGNGSGKTTLLKICATLLAPSIETVSVLGHDIRRDKGAVRRLVRFLGHEKQLYRLLTVEENLNLAAGLRGLARADAERWVSEVTERLGLVSARRRRMVELSEGMKKRVVLARLLAGDPEVILLDEPHPTLDQEGREILNTLLADWRNLGKTILLASHDHDLARVLTDRVVVLAGGRVEEEGVR